MKLKTSHSITAIAVIACALFIAFTLSLLTPDPVYSAGHRYKVTQIKGKTRVTLGVSSSGIDTSTYANNSIDTIRYAREHGATKLTLGVISSDTFNIATIWVQYGERDSAGRFEYLQSVQAGDTIATSKTGTATGVFYTSQYTINKDASCVYFIVKHNSTGNGVSADSGYTHRYILLNNNF